MINDEKVKIETINDEYELELYHLVKMFYPNEEVFLKHNQKVENNMVIDYVSVLSKDKKIEEKQENELKATNKLKEKKLKKRFAKSTAYKALEKLSGKSLPWGCLTGIRPTKVAYDLIEDGVDKSVVKEYLEKYFFVSQKKSKLVYETIKNQKSIIKNDHLISLYINIPICPTRCNYCSFISCEYKYVENFIDDYVDALIEEIRQTKLLIFEKALVVRSIYVGGGTPTVLSALQLDKLLGELSYPVSEFTVECGRSDTIDEEKLLVLKKHGVTRICINPQTFNEKVLKNIGRMHTNKQVFDAYMLAVKNDFVVNMDFIVGLSHDTFSSFKKTIQIALELFPHNITLHTLFLKRKSKIFSQNELMETNGELISKMLDYAYNKLDENGYKPYYLYRQKNQIDSLENVGFCREGKICLFNIDTMEETTSIIACGANAISKRIFGQKKKIMRFANHKDLLTYISNVNQICEKKRKLFS